MAKDSLTAAHTMQLRYCVGITDAEDQRRESLPEGRSRSQAPHRRRHLPKPRRRSPPVKAGYASRPFARLRTLVVRSKKFSCTPK
jgi:hypothetical protein